MEILAILLALAFAFALGVSDAPNATSALVASRTTSYGRAATFSFACHVGGAFIGGTAVAETITRLVRLAPSDVPAVFGSASLAAIAFVAAATRLGIPTSASFGLVGGLAGAALVAGGSDAVNWSGLDGLRPVGTVGVLLGLLVSPFAGVAVAWLAYRVLQRLLRRASHRFAPGVRLGIWAGAGAVALADGTNDGQKAMGLAAGALVASGSLDEFSVPLWVRATVAVVLALGTAVGGGRIVRTVGVGFYRGSAVDWIAAQSSAAAVIFFSAALGFPISTSTVVASSVVGAGADRRPRHVRWPRFGETLWAWAITVPTCLALGALLELGLRELP